MVASLLELRVGTLNVSGKTAGGKHTRTETGGGLVLKMLLLLLLHPGR